MNASDAYWQEYWQKLMIEKWREADANFRSKEFALWYSALNPDNPNAVQEIIESHQKQKPEGA